MTIMSASELLKAQIDKGKLHPEKVSVKGKAGQFQSTRWKGHGKPEGGKPKGEKQVKANGFVHPDDLPKPPPAEKGKAYKPRALPGMSIKPEDIAPEKRFDSVWIMRSRQLIEFAPSSDTVVKKLIELQDLTDMGEDVTFNVAMKAAVAEFKYMLSEEKKGTDIGREWYRADMQRARAALSAIHPSLGDDDNWNMFNTMTALVSPGKDVDQDVRQGVMIYEGWLKTNKMIKRQPNGLKFGTAKDQMFDAFNELYARHGGNAHEFTTWMASETNLGEVNKLREELGYKSKAWGGGKMTDKAQWARLFGPKVGEFVQNTSGKQTNLTLDRWAFRAYKRWKGKVASFKNSAGHQEVDTRTTVPERAEAIALFTGLAKKFGVSAAETQAIMWYYEKRLYQKLGVKHVDVESYKDVAEDIYRERTDPVFKELRAAKDRRAKAARKEGTQGQPELPDGQGQDANLQRVGGSTGGPVSGAGAVAKAEGQTGRSGRVRLLLKSWITTMGAPRAYVQLSRKKSHTKNTQLAGLEGLTTWMGMTTAHRDSKGVMPNDQGVGKNKYAVRDPVVIEKKEEPAPILTIDEVRAIAQKERARIDAKITNVLSQIGPSTSAMFSSSKSEFFYVVHPSPRRPSEWDVTMYAYHENTPTGRFSFASKEKAVRSILGDTVDGRMPIGGASWELTRVSKALTYKTVRRIEGKQFKPHVNRKLQGEINIGGLRVVIECMPGTWREGTDKNGVAWKTFMQHAYGYVLRTQGVDGDGVDAYVGPARGSDRVFIVHQNDPATGRFDENKVMLSFPDGKSAMEAYLSQYNDPRYFGRMEEVPLDEFAVMVKEKRGVALTRKARYTLSKAVSVNTHPEHRTVKGKYGVYTQVKHIGRAKAPEVIDHDAAIIAKFKPVSDAFVRVLGTTDNPLEAGFITPDGQFIKMSNKKGSRTLSHMDAQKKVATALGDVERWDDIDEEGGLVRIGTPILDYEGRPGHLMYLDVYRGMPKKLWSVIEEKVWPLVHRGDGAAVSVHDETGYPLGWKDDVRTFEQVKRLYAAVIPWNHGDDYDFEMFNKAIGPHTHPVRLIVRRNGKTFQQTFHVGRKPNDHMGQPLGVKGEATRTLRETGVVERLKGKVDWDSLTDDEVITVHTTLVKLAHDYNSKPHPASWPVKVTPINSLGLIWGSEEKDYQGFIAQVEHGPFMGLKLSYQHGLRERLQEVNDKFGPKGVYYVPGKSYFSTARSIEAVFIHEYAHILDEESMLSAGFTYALPQMDPSLKATERAVLGDYCHVNLQEYFAEYYTGYKLGMLKGTPLEVAEKWFRENGL